MFKSLIFYSTFLMSVASQAATVTVNGTNYDVIAQTGSFADYSSELTSQVWWNNGALAVTFAQELGGQLGAPNSGISSLLYGPLFAYAPQGDGFVGEAWSEFFGATSGFEILNPDYTVTFATATVSQVPLPAAAWLFGSALVGLVAVKRKKA